MYDLRHFFACTLLLAGSLCARAQVVPGSLDPTFSTAVSGGIASVWATAVQPDGKVILGGSFTTVGTTTGLSNLVRLNADGSVDGTFNASTNGSVYSVTVQADGKILIGGGFTSVNGSTVNSTTGVNRIARLNADGSRDTAFNASGGVGLGGANGSVGSVTLQADGKILIGGYFTSVNGSTVSTMTGVNRIARLNADGSRDTAFNASGGVGLGGANGWVYSVTVQADGKILIGGNFTSVNGSTVSTTTGVNCIARLNADGSRDTAFNTSGGIGLGGANNIIHSVAVQADGKILIGGRFTSVNGSTVSSTTGVNRIARLNADGSRDTAFNTSGGTGLGGVNDWVESLALQADGKILIGGLFTSVNGSTVSSTTGVNRIARLNADGSRDTAFNTSGGIGLGGADNWVESVAVQADGKILIGGGFSSVNGTERRLLARLNNDEAIQTLSAPDAAQVSWTRGGAGPELSQVTFELSTDGGSSYTMLGTGTRIGTSASWQLPGLSLPPSGQFRARGRTVGCYFSGSSGLIEQVASFGGQPPPTTITSLNRVNPAVTNLSTVNWTLTFAAANTGVTASNFSLSGAAAPGATVGTPSTSDGGVTWNVPVTTGSTDGTLSLRFANAVGTTLGVSNPLPYAGQSYTMDKTAPAVSIGPPSLNSIMAGAGTVTYTVTYAGQDSITLAAGHITLNTTGTANATISVSGSSGSTRTVTLSSITGVGTLGISIAADSASDLVGNTALGAGPSTTFTVTARLAPTVDLSTPSLLSDGTTLTITGTGFFHTPGDNTVVFTPTGTGTVTASTATTLTVTSLSGLSLGALNAVVTTPAGNSGPPVQVATVVVSTPGSLAPTFSTAVSGGSGAVYATAVQPDGKVIIGGNFTTVGATTGLSNLARLNADGSVDGTFNASTNDRVYSVAVQADGKILIGGGFTSVNGSTVSSTTGVNYIARLNPDGSRDTAFNTSGGVGLGGANSWVLSVAVQADGKILIGGIFTSVNGSAVSSTTGVNYFARLNADGSRDTAFNTSGGTGLGGADDIIHSVAVQADGKILIGGQFTSVNGSTVNSTTGVNYFARLNADGSRDTAFNTSGGTGLGGADDFVLSVAMQADGKILIGGWFTSVNGSTVSSTTGVNHIARLNADGSRDTAFNTSGGIGLGGANSAVNSVAVQADGKILIGGYFTSVNGSTVNLTTGVNRIARLNPDGSRDTAFNASGGVGLGGANGWVGSVTLQADGKILIGGGFSRVNGMERICLARLNNDAAAQTLSAPHAAQVSWIRGGAGPELSQVTFEFSTDGGSSYTMLGTGTRTGTTASWQLGGLSLPVSGQLRARGFLSGGCSSLIEQVASFSGLATPTVTAWASSFPGISGADTAPEATPFNDGIANLLKYAFNVPLDGPRVAQMTQGTGTSGMPAITFDTTAGTPTSLRIEFLRRKSSGLIYTPQYGYTLASFVPTTAAPVVTSIDANWERVVVVQPLTSGQDRAFSRVAVTAP
jgi:uncharacterized delta-60 repeat protein